MNIFTSGRKVKNLTKVFIGDFYRSYIDIRLKGSALNVYLNVIKKFKVELRVEWKCQSKNELKGGASK